MFRSHKHLEKTEYVRVMLDKPTINSHSPTETTGLTGITPTSGLISLSR